MPTAYILKKTKEALINNIYTDRLYLILACFKH